MIDHINAVGEAAVVADLDATYRRLLVGTVGLDDVTARFVVDDLAQWRMPRGWDDDAS